MILYGLGGHSKVVIDCLLSHSIEIDGIFDDNFNSKEKNSYNILGPYNKNLFKTKEIIISIGDNRIRKKIASNIIHSLGTVTHHSSVISNNVKIGKGTVVFHNATIQSSSIIGENVIINTSSSIDHDCIIEDFVHISPNATLCGNVSIGVGSHIGAGSVILPNVKIGKWCKIGAGSVVINDVPNKKIVVGNPGRIIKENE